MPHSSLFSTSALRRGRGYGSEPSPLLSFYSSTSRKHVAVQFTVKPLGGRCESLYSNWSWSSCCFQKSTDRFHKLLLRLSSSLNPIDVLSEPITVSSSLPPVYPADPDYYGRPAPQDFPQFDIVDDACSTSTVDSRRNSRFGGFPFPLERCDRRAPLPPCYSSQNLDHFLGADGLPLPRSQCPAEFTAISYYPAPGPTRSLDNVSAGGYKRLSVRLSVATPSYAERAGSPPPPPPLPPAPPLPPGNCAQPQARPLVGSRLRSYDGSSIVESDYGSCEEVMF